jgi:hypothetical protein
MVENGDSLPIGKRTLTAHSSRTHPPPKSKSGTHACRNGETVGTLDLSRPRSETPDPPCTSLELATHPAMAPAVEAEPDVAVEAEMEEVADTTTSSSSSSSSRSTLIGTLRTSNSGCGETRPPPLRGQRPETLWPRRRLSLTP